MKRWGMIQGVIIGFTVWCILSVSSVQAWEKDKVYSITILHTNDHHGRFWHNDIGEYGLAAQKTVVDQIRREVESKGGSVLLLSGGDINTGVPESDLQKAEPDFKGMRVIGYDAMAVGNHEFDNSLDILLKQATWANFPFLSANVYYKASMERVFEPYTLFNQQGIKIAVLGLTTDDTPYVSDPENTKDLYFRSPIEEAQTLIPIIKAEERPDIIIAATHMGHYDDGQHGSRAPGDVELARSLPHQALDLIIGGHSQNPVCMVAENQKEVDYIPGSPCFPDRQNGTWIVQAHEWGKYVGRADFSFLNGKLSLDKYELIPINLMKEVKQDDGTKTLAYYTHRIERDAEMTALLTPYQQIGQEALGIKIGEINGFMDGDRKFMRTQQMPLGKLIATAMMEKTDADLAVLGGGSIRDSLLEGAICYRDVLRVLPFYNSLVYVEMTGAELKDYLAVVANRSKGSGGYPQFANVRLIYTGKSVEDVWINQQPLSLDKQYRIATLSFFAAGGDGYPLIKQHDSFVDTGYVISDVVKGYVEANTPLDVGQFAPNHEIIEIASMH